MPTTDRFLVDQCRTGDRDAFAKIVQRYQTLICSIALGATGNLTASEELAQETFVSAWRSIDALREPNKLRQWLCGIVRNLAKNRARGQHRDMLRSAASIDRTEVADESSNEPVDATIAREEAELLDRTLAAMPEHYREPLVLFYREDQSVARVASSLDLSPDAVKQRLARGRKMLREEVMAVVERGLCQSTPRRAFTIGVLAALPVMSGTAKAASVVASAKGVGAMNAAGWTGAMGAILGPLVGLLGAWFGYSASMKSARSDRERAFIKRVTLLMLGCIAAVTIGSTLFLLKGRDIILRHPVGFAIGIIGLVVVYATALIAAIIGLNRRMAQIRREDGTVDVPPSEIAARMPAPMRSMQYPRVFESKTRLLGLPLISVRFRGASSLGRKNLRPAVGWVAIGDIAYGVIFASGSVAVGGIAVGAISFGLVSFGGLAVGLLALGGLAVGGWSLGGVAVGWLSFAGVSVAWKAALGGVSIAHEFAVGGVAVGQQINNEAAKAFVADSKFFSLGGVMMTPWSWWIVSAVVISPTLVALRFVAPAKPH